MRSKRQDFELMGKRSRDEYTDAEREAKRQRQLQPLFTPTERHDINEKWRNHKAVEPGFLERAYHGVLEYFDRTPEYRPNSGPHMMSAGTYANDIITLMRHWDEESSGKIPLRNLLFCKTWVIHLVVQRLKDEGYYRLHGQVHNKNYQWVEQRKDDKDVFILLQAHELKQLYKRRAGNQVWQPKKLPAERPTAEAIVNYIKKMDTQMIITMIHNDTWNALSIYLDNWRVFEPLKL